MEDRWRIRIIRFFAALAVGALLGGIVGGALRGAGFLGPRPTPGMEAAPQRGGLTTGEAAYEEHPGWQYARDLQESQWDAVIRRTLWMQDRLRYVRAQEGTEEAVAEAHQELRQRLQRVPTEKYLHAEGVEDQYVFSPEAKIEFLGVDAGRDDLEVPAASRLWLRITYPDRASALRDRQHIPIRALTAGVNVSESGKVLKASVLGNLEIDRDSISYRWDSPRGS